MYHMNVHRMRKKLCKEKFEESKGKEPIAIGFDERKDILKVNVRT